MAPRVQRYPHLAKEPFLTSRQRGNPENRVWAKAIDFCIIQCLVFVSQFAWVHFEWILPLLLWTFFEQMGRGQSPGKWLLGLHTIEVKRGFAPSLYNSFVRNFPFIVLSTAMMLKGQWWWIVEVPLIMWLALEAFFIFNLRSGMRVGDVLGSTRVNDYKDEHTKFIEQFLKEEESA